MNYTIFAIFLGLMVGLITDRCTPRSVTPGYSGVLMTGLLESPALTHRGQTDDHVTSEED